MPCVATNAVRYARPENYALFDALTCVRLKKTIREPHRDRPVNAQAYLRSDTEMAARRFAELGMTRAQADASVPTGRPTTSATGR